MDKVTILIVEDSSVQALRLRRALEQQGWQVVVAANGREAMTYLQSNRPALVISDIFMPEMNGFELCQAIKQNAELQNIPLLLLTTVSDIEDLFLFLKAPADDYMAKPYCNEDLFAAVRALISNPPLSPEEVEPLSVALGNRAFDVTADRQQMLRLLLSTYRQSVDQSRALQNSQREVQELRMQVQELGRQAAAVAG